MKKSTKNCNMTAVNINAPTSETVEASKNCVIEILNAVYSAHMPPEVAIKALGAYKEGIEAPHGITFEGCSITMGNPGPAVKVEKGEPDPKV